jgi:uncharacterized repeat protein (TIGR03803 family)
MIDTEVSRIMAQPTPRDTFTGGLDGGNPISALTTDSAGNFYGAAISGGTAGFGVVYKLDRSGHETVLYSFTDD